MSMPEDWAEDARIERLRENRRADPQTGFIDADIFDEDDDEFWWQQQDEELQRQEEEDDHG